MRRSALSDRRLGLATGTLPNRQDMPAEVAETTENRRVGASGYANPLIGGYVRKGYIQLVLSGAVALHPEREDTQIPNTSSKMPLGKALEGVVSHHCSRTCRAARRIAGPCARSRPQVWTV